MDQHTEVADVLLRAHIWSQPLGSTAVSVVVVEVAHVGSLVRFFAASLR